MTTLTNLVIDLQLATEAHDKGQLGYQSDYVVDTIVDQMLEHIELEKHLAEGSTLLNTVDVFDMTISQLRTLLDYMMGYVTWTHDLGLVYNIAESRLQSLELSQDGFEDYEDGPDSFDGDSYGAYTIS